MVVFDNTKNFNNRIKGTLYISIMDIDYLMKKLTPETLEMVISPDTVETFKYELRKIKSVPKLSEYYYSMISLKIRTEEDEKLLEIIRCYVDQKKLFTRRDLGLIMYEDLNVLIKPLQDNGDGLNDDDLYKLRSYMMAKHIYNAIEMSEMYLDNVFNRVAILENLGLHRKMISTIEPIGWSSEIIESDYFDEANVLYKKPNNKQKRA